MLSKDNAGMISLLWCDAGDCQLVNFSNYDSPTSSSIFFKFI